MSQTGAPAIYDPCANYRRLRDALERVAAGETVRGTRYRNGEEERQTDFHPGNATLLKELMLQAKAECEAAQTGRTRRSAIRFSSFRRPPYGGL